MWELSFRPEVADDLVAAVAWYDDKRHGLGDDFLSEYLAAITRVHENPLRFAVAANGLRPCRLKRFAYIIHFHLDGRQIQVVAVMAGGRDDTAASQRSG